MGDAPTDAALLSILDGQNGRRRVELKESVTVGRGENAGLVIDDAETSRMHAVFRRKGDLLEIEDLGSLNGTWVNDRRIDRAVALAAGDVVKVGTTRIEVLAVWATRARSPEPPRRDLAAPVAEDELRPVTALFADVVGSTALAERLPPEELKTIVGGCVDRMCRAVERFGGVIDAYMGDGIAAFFGFPVASEDDADRAARAALRLLELIASYATQVRATWGVPDLSVRVGVNSGQVAVGMVGAGERHPVALGDTMSVAARLQAAAEPGAIVIGDATARKIRERFLVAPLGHITVKGREAPVEAWRLLHAQPASSRPEARPLVGRVHETERLMAAANALRAGRGQVVLLLGDPGIGKTRLLEWFHDQAGGATWLEGTCNSYGGQPPYSPFIDALRGWLAIDDAEVGSSVFARLGLQPDVLTYLASLVPVKLDRDESEWARDVPAEQFNAEIRRAYCSWVRALCEHGPVVLAVHDYHWADRGTQELAESLLELVDDTPLVIAATSRVEPGAAGLRLRARALLDHPHHALELKLEPLTDAEAERLVLQLAPGELAEEAKRELIARAEGNPLYLEQLLRSLLETGGLAPRRTWALTVSADQLPSGLESLLIARIDALPRSARRLAQVAAVVGRSFSPTVLEAVSELENVAGDIALLLHADIIRELRPMPEREYAFTHGLLQEAALSTLTRARRRELYGAVATACEQAFAASLDEHLEPLAFYQARAGNLSLSLEYLERAAVRAASLHSNARSAELWKRAADVAQNLDDSEARRRIELQLSKLSEQR